MTLVVLGLARLWFLIRLADVLDVPLLVLQQVDVGVVLGGVLEGAEIQVVHVGGPGSGLAIEQTLGGAPRDHQVGDRVGVLLQRTAATPARGRKPGAPLPDVSGLVCGRSQIVVAQGHAVADREGLPTERARGSAGSSTDGRTHATDVVPAEGGLDGFEVRQRRPGSRHRARGDGGRVVRRCSVRGQRGRRGGVARFLHGRVHRGALEAVTPARLACGGVEVALLSVIASRAAGHRSVRIAPLCRSEGTGREGTVRRRPGWRTAGSGPV